MDRAAVLPWDPRRFQALTFDCYGTLIDWRPGILAALRGVLKPHGVEAGDAELLAHYGRLESAAEQPPHRLYREVLGCVVDGLGRAYGFKPSAAERASLAESVAAWRPYPDTVAALRALKSRYRLGVISNVDDDLFAATARLLQVQFDWVVTAQSVGSYKPARRNFETALSRMGLSSEKVLHVAQSLHHDVAAVKPLGWATAWVNRYGTGPDPAVGARARPDLEVPDLQTLAELLAPGARA